MPQNRFSPLGWIHCTPEPRNALRGALKCEIEISLSPKDLKSHFPQLWESDDWTVWTNWTSRKKRHNKQRVSIIYY